MSRCIVIEVRSLWKILVVATVCALGISTLVLRTPTAALPTATYRVDAPSRVVAMGIALASDEDVLQPILTVLSRQRMSDATFFIDASWATSHPIEIALIRRQRYSIGAYVSLPQDVSRLNDGQLRHHLRTQVARLQALVHRPIDLVHVHPWPDARIVRIAHGMSLRVIASSVPCTLTIPIAPESLVDIRSHIVSALRPGDIVVLPSVHIQHPSAFDPSVRDDILRSEPSPTASLLSTLIPLMRSRGYTWVSLPALFRASTISGGQTVSQ
jgi:peptidoglycan/xylan/chitin deacetylase (PgdA/CDA1 family)